MERSEGPYFSGALQEAKALSSQTWSPKRFTQSFATLNIGSLPLQQSFKTQAGHWQWHLPVRGVYAARFL